MTLLKDAARLDARQFAASLGLRAAVATFVPLVLGSLSGHPAFHFAGIAGFVATTSDKGGAFATRARTFLALACFGALAVFLGSLAGHALLPSVVAALLVVTAGAMARVLGTEAISVGTAGSVLFLIAQATPSTGVLASLERAGLNALGVAWAATLALLLWPVRQYAPARRAVAACFDALAAHVDDITPLLGDAGTAAWHQQQQRGHAMVRTAIEAARGQLAAIRGNNRALTGKTAWLLGLVETSDLTFGRVVALADVVERLPRSTPPRVRELLAQQLQAIANACRALARFATDEDEHAAVPHADVRLEALRALTPSDQNPQLAHALELLAGIDQALETVSPVTAPVSEPRTHWLQQLRATLTWDSSELRHALRVGALVSLSVALVDLLDVDHGYWATLTVLVVLQPHAPATALRSVQRVAGTLVGSLLALAVTALVHDTHALLPLCAVMAAVSVSVIQVNYALYAALLTPTFLLLAQLEHPNPRLVGVRALTTIVAAGIALVASRLLWPGSERGRVTEDLATAVQQLRALFHTAVHAPAAAEAELVTRRRRFGVAISNADVSLQRLVAERADDDPALEAFMTLVLYLRRFCWAALAFASLPGRPTLERPLEDAFDALLLELEESLRQRRAPRPLDSMGLDLAALDPLVRGAVERLEQHLGVLHAAVARCAVSAPVASRARLSV